MQIVLLMIGAYLLGAVPFGLIIAKAHGIDLRKIGSGNIGATNVSRALGRKWAYFCFVLDFAKGLIPMLTATAILPVDKNTSTLLLWLMVGVAAIIGHVFPVYLKFKGGKGVATSLGVILGLWPYFTIPGLAVFAIWCICVLIWHYISLASIIAALLLPIAVCVGIALRHDWTFALLWPLITVAAILCILIVLLHRANIKRILAGTENKVLTGSKKQT